MKGYQSAERVLVLLGAVTTGFPRLRRGILGIGGGRLLL